MRDCYRHWSDISYTQTQQLLRDTLATQVSQHWLSRGATPAPAI